MPSCRDMIRHIPCSSSTVMCISNNYWAPGTEASKMSTFALKDLSFENDFEQILLKPKKNIPSLRDEII